MGKWEAARRQEIQEQTGCLVASLLLAAGAIAAYYAARGVLTLEIADRLAGVVGGLAIVVATIRYLLSASESAHQRQLTSHREAWQTIVGSQGKAGSGGRLQAIELLANDGIVLDGVNLDGAYLHFLQLPTGTSISYASVCGVENFEVDLTLACFRGVVAHSCTFADVHGARINFSDAHLTNSTFRRAKFYDGIFVRTYAGGCRFEDSVLRNANFERADTGGCGFERTNFADASLVRANVEHTIFRDCTLNRTDFRGANMRKARFENCNFDGVVWDSNTVVIGAQLWGCQKLPMGFRVWAQLNGATLKDC